MSNYMRDVKTTASIADAYRSMYAKVDEDVLNEELIDSLIEDVREEEIDGIAEYLDENKDLDEGALADKAKKSGISVGTLRKVYNRGMAAWKTGHRPGTTPQQWGHARVNAFIVKKKKGGLNHDKDLAHVVHPDDSMLDESFSKKMPLKTYADRIGISDKEKQWIMDNEKDEPMYFPNDKFKSALVLSYPVRNGDYYFSFLTDMDDDSIKQARESNLKMNLLLQKEYKQAQAKSKIDFKKEPEKLYALSGHLWNIMTKAFDKLPRNLGAGDTMTRDELFLAIDHIVGAAPQFESYDYQGETIQEGRLSGILGTIANKIRSAKKKIGKRIKLGRKAKGLDSIKENQSPKYDTNILKSVADTYASMQNYGIQGDIVEETQLDEVKRQEVDAMKKLSKDMQAVMKGYQKIANMGDKELKNTVHNKNYKAILDARDKVLTLIGTLNTKMLLQKEETITEGKNLMPGIEKIVSDKQAQKVGGVMIDMFTASVLTQAYAKVNDANKKRMETSNIQTLVKLAQKVMGMKEESELEEAKYTNVHNKIKNIRNLKRKESEFIANIDPAVLGQVVKALMPMFEETQKEFEALKEGAEEMIDKLFNLKGNRIAGLGVAMLLNMTDVKVIKAMQKQNPLGFMKTVNAMGKETGKIKPAQEKEVLKMFKKAGIKPLPEGKNFAQQAAIAIAKKKNVGKPGYDKEGKKIDEKVKDGKLDPLSKMGKSKLTGSEIQKYYRDNPKQKAAARDKTVKKAIELALDLSGATNYAMKEIEKIKRGLSKLPAVKLALQHANESKEFTGHHVIIENLSSTDLIKLKTYGKMLAKMTKLQFDDSKPEQSIDKLMGQIWKQKHVPANWERLHKMVALLNKIGVKMPSLKGKYMGLDPVSKKAIFYKEGTDEIIDWNKDITEIKEGIEDLVEAQEMKDADVKKIAQMTDRNDHNGSLMHLAKVMGDRKSLDALKGIMMTHKAIGHMPKGLIDTRMEIYDDLMKQSKKKYRNHNDIYSAL